MTLRARLVMLVMVGLVPLLGLALIEAWINADEAIDRAAHHLEDTAALAAANQQKRVDSAHHVLVSIAHSPGMAEGNAADCQRYLSSLKKQFPVYATLGLIGLDGYMICHSDGERPPGFFGDRGYFQAALTQRGFVSSEYLVSRATGKPVVVFAIPVTNRENKVTAVAYAAVALDEMSKAVTDVSLPPDSQLVITDRQGTVLVAHPGNSAEIGQRVPGSFLQGAVKTMRAGGGEATDEHGTRRVFVFAPIGADAGGSFFVAASQDRDSVLAPVWKEMMKELILAGLLASLGGWLAWRLGDRAIVKPAAALLDATRRLEQGQLDARIPFNPGEREGEFSRIAAGFNRMADSLQTQRTALQAELAHSQAVQEKLQDAQRLGRIGYWQVNLETQRFWWSDEVYDLLGVDRNGLDGSYESLLQRIHPADRAAYDAVHQAAVQTGKPQNVEFRVVTSAGEVRWIQLFARSDDKAEGKRGQHHAGVLQDITVRKLVENELRDSEQRYAALFEAAPVPMYVFDSATNEFLAVNCAAIQSYGYSAQEFLSMTLFDFYPEVEHDPLRHALAEAAPQRTACWQHRRKDGSVFPVETVSQFIHYADRAARFVVALDITAQTKAEKSINDYLLMLQRAADAAQAITWHQTLQGTLQEVAEQARGVIGAHQAVVRLAAMGSDLAQGVSALSQSEKYASYRDLIEPMDSSGIRAPVSETNRALRMMQIELDAHPGWRGLGGGVDKHPAMRGWLAVPLTDRDGSPIGLLQLADKYDGKFTQQDEYVAMGLAQLASSAIENARLIEEVNQLNTGLEQKVVERTAALRMANQELEAFSYSVSHDLRSPLNTIDGFSQLLARQLAESDNEKAQHYLSRIRAGTAQMGQLIGDLLSLAQVARAQMNRETVDLSALSRCILGTFQARQPERQVVVHIEPGLQVQGDAGLLRVVMENLLGNAWKYSSKQAEAAIEMGQKKEVAGGPVFFVKDNGAGFDMAYANKLFQPFERLHAVAEFSGTGIGLATVSRVIDRHGGRIWAEAAPGRGATFFFTLSNAPVVGLDRLKA